MPLAAHTVGSSFRIESLIGWTSEYEKKVFQDQETLPECNKSKEILEVSTTGQSQARSMATQYNILGRRLGNTEKSKPRGRTECNISNHENWSNITECKKAEETEWDSRSMPPEDQCEILECTQHKDSAVCAKKMITEKKIKVSEKPNHSYIALISTAILSSPEKKLQLSDIYQWIMETYPYYHNQDKSWRNSVRHNLSLNECFIKAGRSDNGKGHYWAVHPANLEAFSRGDYQRRRARRRARRVSSVLGYSSHFHVCTVRCFHRLCIWCSPFYSNSDRSHICPFVGPTSQQVNCPFRMPLLWPWYQIPPYP